MILISQPPQSRAASTGSAILLRVSEAGTAEDTDWHQILSLYDHLFALIPSPIVALQRAVALAEVEGPGAGLAAVDGLPLQSYYLFHAVRADLLRRLGRREDALAAYASALNILP